MLAIYGEILETPSRTGQNRRSEGRFELRIRGQSSSPAVRASGAPGRPAIPVAEKRRRLARDKLWRGSAAGQSAGALPGGAGSSAGRPHRPGVGESANHSSSNTVFFFGNVLFFFFFFLLGSVTYARSLGCCELWFRMKLLLHSMSSLLVDSRMLCSHSLNSESFGSEDWISSTPQTQWKTRRTKPSQLMQECQEPFAFNLEDGRIKRWRSRLCGCCSSRLSSLHSCNQ